MFIYLHMAPVPSPYVRQIPRMLLILRISLNDFTYGPRKCFKIITGPYCSSGLIISTSGDKKSKEEKQLLHLALMKCFSFISSQIIKFIKLHKKLPASRKVFLLTSEALRESLIWGSQERPLSLLVFFH